MTDSFKARTTLKVGSEQYDILSLNALKSMNVDRLPFSLKILLENLLRFEDGVNVKKSDIEALLAWDPKAAPHHEIAFTPARVVFSEDSGGTPRAFPDTLVGTDSHTTMINGLGVLGWGVGGIEAEAA